MGGDPFLDDHDFLLLFLTPPLECRASFPVEDDVEEMNDDCKEIGG